MMLEPRRVAHVYRLCLPGCRGYRPCVRAEVLAATDGGVCQVRTLKHHPHGMKATHPKPFLRAQDVA